MTTLVSNPATINVVSGGTAVADWATRSSASGVFYKENFNYPNIAALANHTSNPCYYGSAPRLGPGQPDPTIFSLIDYPLAPTSGRALRISFPANSGQNSRTMMFTFDPNLGEQQPTNGVQHEHFWFQIVLDGHVHADFPFKDDGSAGPMATPKYLIIDRHDSSTNSGEVVTTNLFMQGHCTAYRLASSSFDTITHYRQSANNYSGDYQYQGAIDTGSPANPVSQTQFRQRYGHFHSDDISIDAGQVTGSSRMSQLGVPRPDEAGVVWNPPGSEKRVVITYEIDRPGDRIRCWQSYYGQAPVLAHDTALDQTLNGAAGIVNRNSSGSGGSGSGYPGFQLSLFLTKNINAGGAAQPTTYADYLEIIASNSPINHPGGFTLPGA